MDSDDDEEPKNEPLLPLNTFFQYCLFIKDQQPVRRDQLPVQTLVMKTVSTATNTLHEVRTLKGQCSTQISTF